MLLKREGFPEEGELVMCTITKIHHNYVFAQLDEYGKSGMIHISEISPGRIRNIRDFVTEGKKVVCKILRINKEKGYIDLSLRRVNEGQKRKKVEEIKQEQKAEKIIETVAKELKKEVKPFYIDIWNKVSQSYHGLHDCFLDIVRGDITLEELDIEKDTAKVLTEIIKTRVKLPIVNIKGILKVSSYDSNGLEIVKSILSEAIKKGGKELKLTYAGGGKYKVIVTADDYKTAEKILKSVLEYTEDLCKEKDCEFSFIRQEKK